LRRRAGDANIELMKRARRVWIGITAVGTLSALALAVTAMRPLCTAVTGSDRISIPLAQLANGAASFFCYRDAAGERLRFVLARDDQGRVHSIIDACRQCGKFHEGYTSSRGELICRVCGNRYKLAAIEKGEASCVPLALPSRRDRDRIEVKVSDLKQVSRLF
jgi:uncharacterized membrane protein